MHIYANTHVHLTWCSLQYKDAKQEQTPQECEIVEIKYSMFIQRVWSNNLNDGSAGVLA
jgi:hypothetical protein